jgi:hypothetical protein
MVVRLKELIARNSINGTSPQERRAEAPNRALDANPIGTVSVEYCSHG